MPGVRSHVLRGVDAVVVGGSIGRFCSYGDVDEGRLAYAYGAPQAAALDKYSPAFVTLVRLLSGLPPLEAHRLVPSLAAEGVDEEVLRHYGHGPRKRLFYGAEALTHIGPVVIVAVDSHYIYFFRYNICFFK